MTTKYVNYPYELDLVKASNWHDYQKYIHFIVRFHLLIDDYQSEDTTYPGDILASFQTFDKVEIINAIEKEHSVVKVDETISLQIISEEIASTIESEILGNIELPVYKVSSKVNATIQEKLQHTLSHTQKESSSVTRRVMERFEVHQTITDDGKQKFHAVACYRPMQSDVYLHYIDYLFADYRTTAFGLRKKKRNMPRPNGDEHVNRIKVNQPLFSMRYWEILPKSSLIYSETQYKNEKKKVKAPDRVTINPLDKTINHPLPDRPERPTLYTLSNIAFPYRWIDREGDWTVEELRQIELDDAEGSAWWFQYGPGKNKAR